MPIDRAVGIPIETPKWKCEMSVKCNTPLQSIFWLLLGHSCSKDEGELQHMHACHFRFAFLYSCLVFLLLLPSRSPVVTVLGQHVMLGLQFICIDMGVVISTQTLCRGVGITTPMETLRPAFVDIWSQRGLGAIFHYKADCFSVFLLLPNWVILQLSSVCVETDNACNSCHNIADEPARMSYTSHDETHAKHV